MGRFSEPITHLIDLLEAVHKERGLDGGVRERVDELLWEFEQASQNAEALGPEETPKIRARIFQAELKEVLQGRQKANPHKALQEALKQLAMPGLRHPDHRL
jgi:hypothetical protein